MYKGSRHYCYQNSRFITAHKGKISWTLPPYLSLALLGVTQGTLRLDPIAPHDSTGNELIASGVLD